MLSKQHRITTAEFKKLGRPTRIFNTSFFSVRTHRIAGTGKKFAVVVSKKITVTAAARNLLRRRLYALLAEHLATATEGTAAVVFVKKEAVAASFQELKAAFEQLGCF